MPVGCKSTCGRQSDDASAGSLRESPGTPPANGGEEQSVTAPRTRSGRQAAPGTRRFGSQAKQGRGCVEDPYVGLSRGRDVDLDGMVGDVAEQDREPGRVASDSDSDGDYVVAWIVGGVRERQALGLVPVAEVGADQFDGGALALAVRAQQIEESDPIGRRRSCSPLSFDRLRRCRFLSLPGTPTLRDLSDMYGDRLGVAVPGSQAVS
jgi:hypothetical protein